MPRLNYTSSFLDALGLALPALTAQCEWPVRTAAGASAAVAASSLFVKLMNERSEDTLAMNADGTPRIILNSIPISHFVERVRWSLDYMGVEYEEEVDIGVIMMLLSGRSVPVLNIPSVRTSIGNSADIFRYLYGKIELKPKTVRIEDWNQFFNPNTTALVPGWKSLLRKKESNEDDESWIKMNASEMDVLLSKLGSAVQGYAYGGTHVDENPDALKQAWGMHLHEWIPWYQRWSMQLGYPLVLYLLRNSIFSNSPENVLKCRNYIIRMVDFISRIIEGDINQNIPARKFILGTDKPTFIDFSFASLIGVLYIDKSQFANGKFRGVPFDYRKFKKADDFVDLVEYIQSSSAGKLINDLYTNYRNKSCIFKQSKL